MSGSDFGMVEFMRGCGGVYGAGGLGFAEGGNLAKFIAMIHGIVIFIKLKKKR